MTSTLPKEARRSFERFVTCELTTVDRRGQPITWPVTPYYRDGDATIDVTTGLGYPKKADDARAHPSIALLFSDPTGSGIDSGIRVLVQGTATVDDEDLEANAERYMRESGEKLPATRKMNPPGLVRGLFAWYYARVYIRVRPERVLVWTDGNPTREPVIHDSHLEEVRSGRSEEPREPRSAPPPAEGTWEPRMDWLAEHDTGVLSWVAPDGFPIAVRVPIHPEPGRKRIAIGAEPSGVPMLPGRACLTVHHHSPDFVWQRNMQVRGILERSGDGWVLIPRRVVGGFELPPGRFSRFRDFIRKGPGFYRTYRRRLKQRA